MTPPSSFVITTVAERGTPSPSGQTLFGLPSANASAVVVAPGCWTLTNIVRRSGVVTTPVISWPVGPVRKRRISPVVGIGRQHLRCCRTPRGRPCSARSRRCRSGSRGGRPRRTRGHPGRRRCCRVSERLTGRIAAVGFGPARTKMFQAKRVAAWSSFASRQRMIWPNWLRPRGFARSACSASAAGVVGQREIDLAGARIDRAPLRPVHLRRADASAASAGVDEDVGVVGEAVPPRVSAVLAGHERQPLTGAVVVELARRRACPRRAASRSPVAAGYGRAVTNL